MCAPGFLPGIFQGGKIYCYANIPIVFGPNFRGGQKSTRGQTTSGGTPAPVEESQALSLFSIA